MHEAPPETIAPVLILGGDSVIGRAWRERLARASISHHAPSPSNIDPAREDSLDAIVTSRWKTLINCASVGSTVAHIAARCTAARITLLHHSTAEVFDGAPGGTLSVRHVRNPRTHPGREAALAEELVEISGADWLIVRSSMVYAPWGQNHASAVADELRRRPVIYAPAHQRLRPTSAVELAKVALALLRAGSRGIWHVTDNGECSPYEFACEIAANLGSPRRVAPAEPEPPRSLVLDLSRTEGLLGPMEHWRVLLSAAMREME